MFHLAIDLGAGSGRGIVYSIKNNGLTATEVHRFGGYDLRDNGMRWDIQAIYDHIIETIKQCYDNGIKLASIGIDTWGVDYTVINKDGSIPNPYHYRDKRTVGIINEFASNVMTANQLYSHCGIAPNEINTVYQVYEGNKSGQFDSAQHFGFVSSILGYMLTGKLATEPTIASTSGFYRHNEGFDNKILSAIGIDSAIMPQVLPIHSILGNIKDEILQKLAIQSPIAFVMTPAHDTASAIAAIPHLGANKLFLSAGTWSLFGTLLPQPILDTVALDNGYSNELGIDNVRFLRNITGFWVLQECMKEWRQSIPNLGYGDINAAINPSKPSQTLINFGDSRFTAPDNMLAEIHAFVKETRQTPLENITDIANCIYTSMALEYRYALEGLQRITNDNYISLNVFGGGCQNAVLCTYIADSLNLKVLAGITEASSLGNALSQMIACEQLKDLHQAHDLVSKSYQIRTFEPLNTASFDALYSRYLSFKHSN